MIVAEGRITLGSSSQIFFLLQWGRNLIVAEGSTLEDVAAKICASMGPQLDSCGRSALIRHAAVRHMASMGPQLDSCGRFIRKNARQ